MNATNVGKVERIAAYSAALFNTGFGLVAVVTLCGMVFITRPQVVLHDIAPEMWLPLLIIIAPAQIYAQILTWLTIYSGTIPTGPVIAMRQPSVPYALRLIVVLLWLCNFLIGLAIVISLSKPHPGKPVPIWFTLTVIPVLAFWLSFAANVYLLLAVKTWTESERLVQAVWRYKIPIDLATVIFAVGYYHL